VKWDYRFVKLAEHVAQWSKDPSTKTGAVITDGRDVVSLGYNGFAPGIGDDASRYENRDLKYKLVVHCEMNAMLSANRPLKGCTLYTWPFMSCSNCAKHVIKAGIKRCVAPRIPEDKRERWAEDMALSEMQFQEAGVEVVFLDTEDPRKTALKNGLRQLTVDQIIEVLRRRDDLVFDKCNYKDGKFCPLAVGFGIDKLDWHPDGPTDALVFEQLKHRGLNVYNTRGIAGDFYTTNRKRDLVVAAEEVLREKLCTSV